MIKLIQDAQSHDRILPHIPQLKHSEGKNYNKQQSVVGQSLRTHAVQPNFAQTDKMLFKILVEISNIPKNDVRLNFRQLRSQLWRKFCPTHLQYLKWTE